MLAFLAIEISLNDMDEVCFTVSMVSRLTPKPSNAWRASRGYVR